MGCISMGIRLLFIEIQAGIAVLVILLARFGMKKLPRIYSYVLWMLVFARLLFPFSFESRIGLVPSVPEGELRLEEAFNRTGLAGQGIQVLGTEAVHMPEGEGDTGFVCDICYGFG